MNEHPDLYQQSACQKQLYCHPIHLLRFIPVYQAPFQTSHAHIFRQTPRFSPIPFCFLRIIVKISDVPPAYLFSGMYILNPDKPLL